VVRLTAEAGISLAFLLLAVGVVAWALLALPVSILGCVFGLLLIGVVIVVELYALGSRVLRSRR
jgi:hypothetical protein